MAKAIRKMQAKQIPAAMEAPPAGSGQSAGNIFDEPVAFDDDGLRRVQEIIRNARTTWFALLGALVFAAITLASIKDVSFFISSVETKLPIVGMSVPVTSFFWAGALLIAALYAYFHLYLELLWQALGDAPARVKDKPLADRIEPWIVADSALRLRDRLRRAQGEERAGRQREMAGVSDLVSFGLVWLFGVVIIGVFWWRSMPKHEPLFTGLIGIVFAAAFGVFLSSLWTAWNDLAGRAFRWRWQPVFFLACLVIFGATLSRTGKEPSEEQAKAYYFASFGRWAEAKLEASCGAKNSADKAFFCLRIGEITRAILHPASANLREVVFTEKPKDWQGKDIAEAEFRVRWCKERGEKCQNPLALDNRDFGGDEEIAFQKAWSERWEATLRAYVKPDLRHVDWRGADLAYARLEGVDLSYSKLDGANFENANLDRAKLHYASLKWAGLVGANLQNVEFNFAVLNDASLDNANAVGAVFENATLNGALLTQAHFEGANLIDAKLNAANLSFSYFDGAMLGAATLYHADMSQSSFIGANFAAADLSFTDLSRSHFDDAIFSAAKLHGATFGAATFEGTRLIRADLLGARIFGEIKPRLSLNNAVFTAANFAGSAFRYADLGQSSSPKMAHINLAFGDASVSVDESMPWPCHWGRKDEGPLDDEQFYGRWRGWVEANGLNIGKQQLTWNYPAIPPPDNCFTLR